MLQGDHGPPVAIEALHLRHPMRLAQATGQFSAEPVKPPPKTTQMAALGWWNLGNGHKPPETFEISPGRPWVVYPENQSKTQTTNSGLSEFSFLLPSNQNQPPLEPAKEEKQKQLRQTTFKPPCFAKTKLKMAPVWNNFEIQVPTSWRFGARWFSLPFSTYKDQGSNPENRKSKPPTREHLRNVSSPNKLNSTWRHTGACPTCHTRVTQNDHISSPELSWSKPRTETQDELATRR